MTGFDWRLLGACTVKQAEDFFPLAYGADHVKAAKERCGVCPVATRCLEWAEQHNETEGVWGGLTYTERRKLDAGPLPGPKTAAPPKPKEPKPIPLTCGNGHELNAANLRFTKGNRDRWWCGPCNAQQSRAARRRRAARRQRVPA